MSDVTGGGKKVLIITGTTDIGRPEDSNDSSHEELFELTLPSKQKYAKKRGYDLLIMRSFGDSYPYGLTKNDTAWPHNEHIGFLRAITAFEMLFIYETVFWIDSDSIITNHDYDLNTFGVNPEKTLYSSYDWEWKNSFSTGNFILHRTPVWKELFRLFLQLASQNFSKHSAQEQATLNFIHKHTEMSKTIQILEHKYLNAVPKVLEKTNTWTSSKRSNINWPWDKNCFLAHIGGLTNNERIEIIKNNFSQYI
jgi:hypothetical protein